MTTQDERVRAAFREHWWETERSPVEWEGHQPFGRDRVRRRRVWIGREYSEFQAGYLAARREGGEVDQDA